MYIRVFYHDGRASEWRHVVFDDSPKMNCWKLVAQGVANMFFNTASITIPVEYTKILIRGHKHIGDLEERTIDIYRNNIPKQEIALNFGSYHELNLVYEGSDSEFHNYKLKDISNGDDNYIVIYAK